ncbi:hypothetical protein BT96DRAFT_1003343 [Gymnopus androsaceus JB14]|uniref:Uncharacterized protein n=1 Tax=Gymnopus androsaceus JB14 TaxID=1447944 RepID=A0A6A4GV20_9AGAR|nr:hypothetical protein BT96DRAFT_1003343 [Gymnopus androsaceus JB14]
MTSSSTTLSSTTSFTTSCYSPTDRASKRDSLAINFALDGHLDTHQHDGLPLKTWINFFGALVMQTLLISKTLPSNRHKFYSTSNLREKEEEGNGGQVHATLLSNHATTFIKLSEYTRGLANTSASPSPQTLSKPSVPKPMSIWHYLLQHLHTWSLTTNEERDHCFSTSSRSFAARKIQIANPAALLAVHADPSRPEVLLHLKAHHQSTRQYHHLLLSSLRALLPLAILPNLVHRPVISANHLVVSIQFNAAPLIMLSNGHFEWQILGPCSTSESFSNWSPFQAVFSAFAKMETQLKEYERDAVAQIPRSKSAGSYTSYTNFEKQFGTRTMLEATVLGKQQIQYKEELSHDSKNYDFGLDYARL